MRPKALAMFDIDGNDTASLFTSEERSSFDALAVSLSLLGGTTGWDAAMMDTGEEFALIHCDGVMVWSVERDPEGRRAAARVVSPDGTVHCRGSTMARAALRQARSCVLRYNRERAAALGSVEVVLDMLEISSYIADPRWSELASPAPRIPEAPCGAPIP